MGRHSSQERAVGGIGVDDAPALACPLVVAARLLLRVGNKDHAVQVLDAERGVTLGQVRVDERAGPGLKTEGAIEDVDSSVVEVGGVQVIRTSRYPDREALVDGTSGRLVGPDLRRGPQCGRQPEMIPASLANRNRSLWKELPPLNTVPVGAPWGIVTTRPCLAPVALYRVDLPVPLSATHHGLVGARLKPQPFTRSESVASLTSTLTI